MPPFAPPTPNRRQALLLAAGTLSGLDMAQAAPGGFWPLLRQGGFVVLMRHAQTEPGVGDPPGFTLGRCETQRNLSAAGRAQAGRVGEAFRRESISIAAVRSSAWCRCTDTARLAFGRYTVWPAINSFFQGQGEQDAQTREVLATVGDLGAPINWVLVTHQVNITALTGEHPAMGELFLTRADPAMPGRLKLLARHTV
ncbi:histidine phosphatase family protein [Hydrogenophaga pseudoflava]|uniref:histidine phosphatase family protein n=1 Tax=Hydrogenophaga pseudoflava TaxID=47421 RepID=UPI0027E5419E|nr:histidine phosphatase family protein [Hydrogenophaga pseudoflava]MDQ7742848.1 histidine phosphatase family protein [Hydrogenophaga pseudoflava]